MTYILIEWPESQEYMEYHWFEEESILGDSSSYYIPEERFIETMTDEFKQNYIKGRIKELANLYPSTKEDEEYIQVTQTFEGGMTIPEAIIHIKITTE